MRARLRSSSMLPDLASNVGSKGSIQQYSVAVDPYTLPVRCKPSHSAKNR